MTVINSRYLSCPIRQVISRFGDKWSILVLRALHDSQTGVLRYSELHRTIADCSQKMLTSTLRKLEQSRLIHRKAYPEVPPRVEYSLTETGRSLMPVLDALVEWATQHFDEVVGTSPEQS